MSQTWQDFELIILDDASTDKSTSVIETFRSHPKVSRILYNDHNSGSPFIQWKKGLEPATGDWIWIAESDDYCESDFLEAMLPAMSRPDCVLAFHEATWVDEQGIQLKVPYKYPSFSLSGREFIRQYMLLENRLVNAGQLIFRRSALSGISSRWYEYLMAGDYRLFCEILANGTIYATGVPRAYFVRHLNALSINSGKDEQAIAERNETWLWLLTSGIVSTAQFTLVFTTMLAGLETVKKGMPANVYAGEKMHLYQLAESMGLTVNNCQVMLESYKRKAYHWWHSKSKGV